VRGIVGWAGQGGSRPGVGRFRLGVPQAQVFQNAVDDGGLVADGEVAQGMATCAGTVVASRGLEWMVVQGSEPFSREKGKGL